MRNTLIRDRVSLPGLRLAEGALSSFNPLKIICQYYQE